jgi:hypothetical protein
VADDLHAGEEAEPRPEEAAVVVEVGGGVRLLEDVQGAERERAEPHRLRAVRGEDQDRRGGLGHDPRDAREAVGVGHVEIHGDDVGLHGPGVRRGGVPVRGERHHLEPGLGDDHAGEHVAEQLRVVRDEDADRPVGPEHRHPASDGIRTRPR